jgi:hypothetical protein
MTSSPRGSGVSNKPPLTMPTLHRVVYRPRYESRPYRPCPARREHIYGRIQPMDAEPVLPAWAIMLGLAIAAPFVASLIGGVS